MPGPLDALKSAYNWATTPVISEEDAQPTIDAIAQPGLNTSVPAAMLRGFAGGALEGVRQQATPLNLATIAAPLARTLGFGSAAALDEAAPVASTLRKVAMPAEFSTGGTATSAAAPSWLGEGARMGTVQPAGAMGSTPDAFSSILSRGGRALPEAPRHGLSDALDGLRQVIDTHGPGADTGGAMSNEAVGNLIKRFPKWQVQ